MKNYVNKTVSFIKVWAYHGDGGERGTGPILGYTSNRHDAEVKSQTTGFYGGKGWVSEHSAIQVNNAVYILADPIAIDLDGAQEKRDSELRVQTLASLSDEQKRVLGLK